MDSSRKASVFRTLQKPNISGLPQGTAPKRAKHDVEPSNAAQRDIANTDALERVSPAEFMRRACIDPLTNQVLSQEEADKNIEDLFKHQIEVDYMDMVKLACTKDVVGTPTEKLCLMTAYSLMQIEQQAESEPKKNQNPAEKDAVVKNGFDLDRAIQKDQAVTLPGGLDINITACMTPAMAANWTYTGDKNKVTAAITRFFVRELNKVEDSCVFIYTTPSPTEKKCTYVPLDEHFFNTFAAIIISGFNWTDSKQLRSTIISIIKSTFTSSVEKLRKKYNDVHGKGSAQELAKEYLEELEKDPNFLFNQINSKEDKAAP